MDIDSLPIGVKPTNKMSFEQLIEEKLKIKDQLDNEQAKYGSKKRQKQTRQQQQQQQPHPQMKFTADEDQEDDDEEDGGGGGEEKETEENDDDEEDETEAECEQQEPEIRATSARIKPRQFLKKGEGLKRYQPPSKKNKKAAPSQNVKSNLNSASSSRITATAGSNSSKITRTTSASSLANPKSTKTTTQRASIGSATVAANRKSLVDSQSLNRAASAERVTANGKFSFN
jgi:hypothetical protein